MQPKNAADVLLAVVVLGGGLMAQTTTPTTPSYLTAVTTGMVGIAASQTAQLNVLNITMAAATASLTAPTAPTCPVEMDLLDSQGRTLKTTTVSNLAPGTAASLTLTTSAFPTASPVSLHTLVRGVVKTNPASATTGGITIPGGIAVSPIYFEMACSVFITLEVFDSTGVTQTFTSDTRSLQQSFVVPLANRVN